MMYNHLKDIIAHTLGIGGIELIKVTGTTTETRIDATAEDRSVIVRAIMHAPIPEFVGQFGMPNLPILNTILNIPEYQKDAQITVQTKGTGDAMVPSGLTFVNKDGNFKNDYRFMSSELVNKQLSVFSFNGVKWDVDFVPTVLGTQRMKFMAAANSSEATFKALTENGALKFYFGDHSSHAGNFVFEESVKGTIAKGLLWPVGVVLNVLGLPGDKQYRISDEGASEIIVDSGLATYYYTLPGQQK